jgi:DNA modification methylase
MDSVMFYCRDATERFLEEESVDLFIGHPPYYMLELDGNGGDRNKQMQNAESLEEYWERFLASVFHMEYALKPSGQIVIALQNTHLGLGVIPEILNKTSLKLQGIRIWDYSKSFDAPGNHTVVFVHLAKHPWGGGSGPQGDFVMTNSWEEAVDELDAYHDDYATTGAAPKGLYDKMIETLSKERDVVCDLFAGSGTVGLVAIELNRKFIFNDVSEDKLILAKKRIEDYVSERQ